jgi:hypothetical protein
MASESEMEINQQDLMEDLKDRLIVLLGDLKKMGYDFTDTVKPLLIDTRPPEHQIPKLRARIERLQNILESKTPTPTTI